MGLEWDYTIGMQTERTTKQQTATVTLVIAGQVWVGTGRTRDEALANLQRVEK